MESYKNIAAEIILRNNTPLDDFLGLTPTEIHNLAYDPFKKDCPIRLRDTIDDHTLDQIPFFKVSEEYLRIIQRDKCIKVTPRGALPKKVLVELYDKRILLDEFIESGIIKLWKERDCISIMSARLTVELVKLVKMSDGKLMLTKKGTELLKPENRLKLFKEILEGYTGKYAWSFNDGYPEQPVGQFAWMFSIFMLDKFGDQNKTIEFYAEKYRIAFPFFMSYFSNHFTTQEAQFIRCYGIRTFERFLCWFGLATVVVKQPYENLELDEYRKTAILKKIFHIDSD